MYKVIISNLEERQKVACAAYIIQNIEIADSCAIG